MARFLYTLAFALLLPLIVLRLLLRSRRHRGYRARMAQRFGFVEAVAPGGIWLHAVSVGETIAAIPLIEQLLQRYPDKRITVTSTTPTGADRVRAAFGERVHQVYAPYDLPVCVALFLRRVKPCLCLIMETELWPNLLQGCKRTGVRTVLVNARLSKRSARGYRKFSALTRPMLSCLDQVAAQQAADARRLIRVGLPAARCQITGSIKSDVQSSPAQKNMGANLRAQMTAQLRAGSDLGGGVNSAPYIVIAASTHAGEDEMVLQAFASLRRQVAHAQLILVPRHPERFDDVARMAAHGGWRVSLRSTLTLNTADSAHSGLACDVLIGDSMGELMAMYAAADVAFVGGSLVARGGHNLLEPAALALPIVQGPHTFNFAVLSKQFRRAAALRTVHNSAELAQVLLDWQAPAERKIFGERAVAVIESQRGALAKVLALIAQQL